MKNKVQWLHNLSLLTLIIFVGLLYLGLGKPYLFEWDEAIYAQLGVELRTNHDFLTPHWNRDLWLEKPPAIAWVTTLGQSLTSDPELGSRLLMPIFAGLTLFAVYQIGSLLGGTALGASSMAILGYFSLFLSRARTVNTDMMLLAAITWLVYLLLKGSKPWKVGLVAALAVFAKGPAGLLALIISTPLLMAKSRQYWLLVLGYWFLFTVPWHLYQLIVHGASFYTPYFLEQVLRRATVPIEFHLESRWFYFVTLYKDLGLGVLIASILGLYFSIRRSWLIMFWTLLPLIIFTLAKTRLAWYILPAYPGIALAVGTALTSLARNQSAQKVLRLLVIGMLAQMIFHASQYVKPASAPSSLPDHIQLAQLTRAFPAQNLAYLVSKSERVAEAILPVEQSISSSFRYGGAPSVVFYSGKKVYYYYNYETFRTDLAHNPSLSLAIVNESDIDKLPPGFIHVDSVNSLLLYEKKELYADR